MRRYIKIKYPCLLPYTATRRLNRLEVFSRLRTSSSLNRANFCLPRMLVVRLYRRIKRSFAPGDVIQASRRFGMTNRRLALSLILCLGLVPLALAEDSIQETTAEESLGCVSQIAFLETIQELGPQEVASGGFDAYCSATADCSDGSQVTCSASGASPQCSATDSSCPGTRGSCWSSDEGTKYCNTCPPPACTAKPCSFYEGRSCSPNGSQSPQCKEGNNCFHCVCFGGTYMCP